MGAAARQRLGSNTQSMAEAAIGWAGLGRKDSASTLFGAGAQSQPVGEGGSGGKTAQVGSNFRQQGVSGELVDAGYGRQIDPEQSVQSRSHIEMELVLAALSPVLLRRRAVALHLAGHRTGETLDLLVAFSQQELIVSVRGQRLLEREQVFSTIITGQRFDHGLTVGVDLGVAQASQLARIALAGHDGVDDRHTAYPGDVRQHMVNLQIHLRQSFLHVLDVHRGALHQAGAMTAQRAKGADRRIGPEGGFQQAHRVRYCNHWQSLTSDLRPGTWRTCWELTRQTRM